MFVGEVGRQEVALVKEAETHIEVEVEMHTGLGLEDQVW